MAEIQPFRGVLYRVPESDLPKVLAPPYDVISPTLQADLYARDARNVVRLVLNREAGEAGYEEAGSTYRRWIAEGTLAADPAPAVYVLAGLTVFTTLQRILYVRKQLNADPQV